VVLEIRLLGPVEINADGRAWEAGPPQQRHVLAALAVDAGRPVTTDVLIDRVWDAAPTGARRTLHVHITRLRRLLAEVGAGGAGQTQLVRRSGGYVLDIDADLVDLHSFRRLVERARVPACPDDRRVALLDDARALWRGEALAGLPGAWAAQCRQAWHQLHLQATEAWAQAQLRVGDPQAVIGVLTDLTTEQPFVESAAALLMRALYAAGRGADASQFYLALRRRLVEELGTDPSAELQALHQAVLRQDGVLSRSAPREEPPRPAAVAAVTPPANAPAQLPLDVRGFTGRAGELAQLDALLAATGEQPTAVIITALSGTAGVGKTALAVHWAHRVADRFPDGQLYVNLRGFAPAGSAATPAEAVRGFLHALQVPAQRMPTGLDEQTALYRSLLAGKRMLVVLDNARDADQVRPLLPGTAGCVVLVTSRNHLAGLVAAEGAHPITLNLLTRDEAHALMARRLGPQRVSAEPQAVEAIITACARLPLAIVIVAARAATRPMLSLADLAADLREAGAVLDAFAVADSATDARAVFSWSYHALTPDAATLFRLLGLHPGPDITAPAAASLTGQPTERARALLAQLAQAHLVTERIPGRYSLHDLLRAYAAELTQEHDPHPERLAAAGRLFDHYLTTAYRGALLLYPRRHAITLGPARPQVTPEDLVDHRQATAWFTAEHPVLIAAIEQAASTGFESHAWRLAWTLWDFLDRRGQWQDLLAIQQTALKAAERLADRAGEAHSHHGFGIAYDVLGSYEDARHHLRRALDLFAALEDHNGQANIQLSLCVGAFGEGDLGAALDNARRALKLFRAAGNRFGQAGAHNNIGLLSADLGDHQLALEHCREALLVYEEEGDRHGQATGWDSLGSIHHHLGDYEQSVACYQRSLDAFRDLGDRPEEAHTLSRLGGVHRAFGHLDAARDAWRQALAIFVELDHPSSERVRDDLHQLEQPTDDA
jgi:DNA-binding SARP family transcriptional activator/tetratricopeptide (TPR) repeat protein